MRDKKKKQSATGPRSTEGKRTSSQNALKAGFRSKAIVNSKQGELLQEYQKFLDHLTGELRPVGILEEVITERLASICWRLRRLSRLELNQLTAEGSSSTGRSEEILRDAIKTLEAGGSFSLAQLQALRTIPTINWSSLLLYDSMVKKNASYNLTPTKDRANIAKPPQIVLLDQLNDVLQMILAATQRQESTPAPLLSIDMNISRYEVALSRQLYKTIGELERLQRTRKGDYVPPPIKIGITET